MGKGLLPIIIALVVLVLIFGRWFITRHDKIAEREIAEHLRICGNTNKDTLYICYDAPGRALLGYSATQSKGETMYITKVSILNGTNTLKPMLRIDTTKTKYIDIYGKLYSLSEIPVCD